MGSWVHDLGEQESSSGILTWDMRVTCLGGSHDESVKDRRPRGGIMTGKLMLTEVTQRASGQSRIHSQDYWSLEPVPFTDKTIGTLLPTPLLAMPSLHQD